MIWFFWAMGVAIWVAAWILLGSRRTAMLEGDDLVIAVAPIVPGFALATCLVTFLVTPASVGRDLTLWVHHAAIFALFLFLITAEYFLSEAGWKTRRGAPASSIVSSYRRLWILAEVVPAPVALVIFLTGLRLVFTSPDTNSPSHAWLAALIAGFSLFFWDGLFGYQPIVRQGFHYWKAAALGIPPGGSGRPRLAQRLQLLVHCLSFPPVFLLGLTRWEHQGAITTWLAHVQATLRSSFLPPEWSAVAVAIGLWGAVGLFVALARTAAKVVDRALSPLP